MKKHPFGVWCIYTEWHDIHAIDYYEVRRQGRGTPDDWEQGEWFANFDSKEEAQACADQLNKLDDWRAYTWTLEACPRCGRSLSNTSYEQYCSDADCRWNNEEPPTVDESNQ